MGNLIENGDGFWEDLSIRLPIIWGEFQLGARDPGPGAWDGVSELTNSETVLNMANARDGAESAGGEKEPRDVAPSVRGLDGYGMVIRAVQDDARDQFFLVSVYEGFTEKDNGRKVMHGCTEFADLDELEAVTRGLLEQVCAVHDILLEVREQVEQNGEAYLKLENGRAIEVSLVDDEDLDEDEQYFVVQLLCNDAENRNQDYRKTDGVIDSYSCSGKDLDEVVEEVKRALRCNDSYPVTEWSCIDKDNLEAGSLDSKIQEAEGKPVVGREDVLRDRAADKAAQRDDYR